jgi:hypothetical protein
MSNTADMGRSDRPRWADERPRFFETPWHPGWIVLTVLGFIFWWPLGLALLFFTIWSRNMGCGHGWQGKMERMQSKMERKMDRMRSRMGGQHGYAPSSGNRAFDDYRADTLRRLEDEQMQFKDFLDRLRHAKDKAEFDQFMNERRNRPAPGPDQPQG